MSSEDSDLEPGTGVQEEDFYTFLGINRDATEHEINNAYHRLSRIYHPDKVDKDDVERKKEAIELFNRTKKAHEVLIDPHKRAIYDTLGEKGLQTEDWKVVLRTKSPQEIREEFERIQQERQERLLQQRTAPRGSFVIKLNATDLFVHQNGRRRRRRRPRLDFYELFSLPRLEVTGMSVTQAIDVPFSLYDRIGFSGALDSDRGKGSGNVAATYRKIWSEKAWTELQMACGQGPLFLLRGSRAISQKCLLNGDLTLHFFGNKIGAGAELAVGRHFSKHLAGYLTWKAGIHSSMNTTLVYDKERNRFQSQVQLGFSECYLSCSYMRRLEVNSTRIKTAIKAGTLGIMLEYGCETKITKDSNVGATMVVGNVTGITLRLKLIRGNQNYVFNVLLCEELVPAPIIYGTLCPIVGFYCVKKFIIEPYRKAEQHRKQEQFRRENAEKLLQRKRQAESSIVLMQKTYERSLERERTINGLVIILALYGQRNKLEEFVESNPNLISPLNENDLLAAELAEVTVPLQCLVRSSTLTLPDASKCNLAGFFDTSPGEDKQLYIKYELRGDTHEKFYLDLEKVAIS